MKNNLLKCKITALLPSALLVLTSCSTPTKQEADSVSVHHEGVPGKVILNTYKITANVTSIDTANRRVTLVGSDGKPIVFKAGPEVTNFAQIQVGDRLKVTMVEEVAVYLAEQGPPPDASVKPEAGLANTKEVTAKVKSIDPGQHKVTLVYPDGSTHKLMVRNDVDLSKRKVGEEVVIRTTDAMAIKVEKP